MTDGSRVSNNRVNGDWRRRAACRNIDPDLFFPLGRAGAVVDHIEAAKAVCQQCAVRIECLDFALATHQGDGIWGGTTEDERRSIRATRRAREEAASPAARAVDGARRKSAGGGSQAMTPTAGR